MAAKAAEIEKVAAELGARHVERTQAEIQQEAQDEDDTTASKYANLGQKDLATELGSVQAEVEELRRQLGL